MAEMLKLQGRVLAASDLEEIRRLIASHPGWHRRRISEELARQWNWRNSAGQLKDMAARTLLLKLHQRDLIELPERRCAPARRGPQLERDLFDQVAPEPITAPFASLLPLKIQRTGPRQPGWDRFQRHLSQHHYLSYGGPVGENIGYLIASATGEDLACLLFGAAAWQCAPRDQWIGWSSEQRRRGLQFIVHNSRFLILPWVRVKSLASHILSQVSARISADWLQRYGHPIYLLETFVQQDRFRGTCYRAANWIHVGRTTGRTRQTLAQRAGAPFKEIYLSTLSTHAKRHLAQL
jgi:hypothetical protein